MRWAAVLGASMTAALVVFAVMTTPGFFAGGAQPWLGIAGAMAVLLGYGLAGYLGAPALRRAGALGVAGPLGLAAGLVYAAEIGLEYALRPADNTPWGLAEFGLVFGLMALTGGVLAWRTRRFATAVAGGAVTAMVGALVWYAALLAMTCLFRGTAAQAAVFRAEGDYQDFARSGMSDFKAFVMQDDLGAGFYHLSLSPLFGLLLASIGAAPVLVWRRLRA